MVKLNPVYLEKTFVSRTTQRFETHIIICFISWEKKNLQLKGQEYYLCTETEITADNISWNV